MLRTLPLAGLLACIAVPAAAADFSFTRLDGTENPFTFTIPTNPTPDSSGATVFTMTGVSTNETGPFGPLIYDADYVFHTAADGGGFENGFTAYFGGQLFGGPTTAPIFYNGSYDLTDFGGGPTVARLVITDAATTPTAVPEPATWALLIGGMGVAGSALRRRRLHGRATPG